MKVIRGIDSKKITKYYQLDSTYTFKFVSSLKNNQKFEVFQLVIGPEMVSVHRQGSPLSFNSHSFLMQVFKPNLYSCESYYSISCQVLYVLPFLGTEVGFGSETLKKKKASY